MGFFDKIKDGLSRTKDSMSAAMNTAMAEFTGENYEVFDDLEDMLIISDTGAETSTEIIEQLKEYAKANGCRGAESLKKGLRHVLASTFDGLDSSLRLTTKPSVILMVGVNGVGKTTSIGKIAARLVSQDRQVLLSAGDTFRAAAAEQLEVWAQRSGCEIVRHEEGSDPAAVVFDSIAAAKARNKDVIMIDTAGRLHNKANLMNELNKIRRIIDRELPEADVECLMVLDATTGQNGLIQAKQFAETAGITGVVLTKLDGTAKGGIVFAIAKELSLPVKFIGVGEGIEDLLPFNAEEFAEAFVE